MDKVMNTRTEKDALGNLEVPADAYYGIFTERAKRNFQISGICAERNFIKALALIKKAAAAANVELGLLDKRIGEAIAAAAGKQQPENGTANFPLTCFRQVQAHHLT